MFMAKYKEYIDAYFAASVGTRFDGYGVLVKDVKEFLGKKYDEPEYTWFLFDTIRALEESRNERE